MTAAHVVRFAIAGLFVAVGSLGCSRDNCVDACTADVPVALPAPKAVTAAVVGTGSTCDARPSCSGDDGGGPCAGIDVTLYAVGRCEVVVDYADGSTYTLDANVIVANRTFCCNILGLDTTKLGS